MSDGYQTEVLNVYSTAKTISGEVFPYHQGKVCFLVRLAGCNLRCSYCDAKAAQDHKNGVLVPVETIADEAIKAKVDTVLVTGGEPLLQPFRVRALVWKLLGYGIRTVIETNGSVNIPDDVPARYVVDFKLPSSGQEKAMRNSVFNEITHKDVIKFVVGTREDLEFAYKKMQYFREVLGLATPFAVSPVLDDSGKPLFEDGFTPGELADEILKANIPGIILSVQLHKIIWATPDNGAEVPWAEAQQKISDPENLSA